ncbi:hypothetical protein GCM10010912_00080 [Paenibacillus albidus]|uniref:Polysaccharide pyruvyl transferase domain-containing protein n=1 Tax=Paenibacillus albidus TaxID=2041023 RepID=A0A917BVU5_9BACL|nr:polysaccharide pyruvyl transferase family protein [Paenibacillus albidus]GGF58876.1 hypothetical protein GCM10010912_00080 [Paenibacillus albidus]
MKKVMINAYTHLNLGDDLFIKILCERYPDSKFLIHAPRKYRDVFRRNKNIEVYSSDGLVIRGINYILRKMNIFGLFQRIISRKCDALVHIGGSIFIEGEKWESRLNYIKKMISSGKPYFLLGANFGPYTDKNYYLQHKIIFKNCTDICFREKHSYEMFKELENVRIADDIVFQIAGNKSNIIKKGEVQAKKIIISVIKPSIRKYLTGLDEVYYNKILGIMISFIEKGWTVTLMAFCEYEGDNDAIDRIIELTPLKYSKNVSKYYYSGNLEESLNVLSESDFIVASRFHAMILGWVFEVPVFPIVYSEKMTNVIEDVGFKGEYFELKNISTANPREVYRSLFTNRIDVSRQAKNAAFHFKILDNYLTESID